MKPNPFQKQLSLFRSGEASFEFQTKANEYANIFSIIPWVRFFFPETSSFRQCREASMTMFYTITEIIDQQVKTYQEGRIRNFVDVYIKRLKANKLDDKKLGFSYEQLTMICLDFMALHAQVTFLLRVLLHKKEVMRKIQDEIQNVVGSSRFPDLDDRIK